MKRQLSVSEVFLLQVIVYIVLWLVNRWLATLISVFMLGIVIPTLIVSLASERIEKSNVGRRYFYLMGATIIAPISVGLMFLGINSQWLRVLLAK